MVDPANVRHHQSVSLLKGDPPVAPAEEFVRQPEPQISAIREVADSLNAEFGSARPGHHQSIGVVESELLGDADSIPGQMFAQRLEGQWYRVLYDLLLNRSRI